MFAGLLWAAAFEDASFRHLTLISLALLYALVVQSDSVRRAAALSAIYGFAAFVVGTRWVAGAAAGVLGLPAGADLLFAVFMWAYFASFVVMACGVTWLVARPLPALLRAPAYAAAIALFELARSTWLTGFTGGSIGHSQVPDGWFAPVIPWVGTMGATFLIALAGAGLAEAITALRARAPRLLLAAAALLAVALAVPRLLPAPAEGESRGERTVQLFQLSIPTGTNAPDLSAEALMQLIERRVSAALERADADIVVFSETVIPGWLPLEAQAHLLEMAQQRLRPEQTIVLGVGRDDGGEPVNALLFLGEGPPQSYRKRHLVPFGEYTPAAFTWLADALQSRAWQVGEGAGLQPPPFGAGLMFAPTICYEDLFDFSFRDYLPDADVLLGSSDLIGMASRLIVDQHAQVSRVRALEYGRPFLRAANGGWSGVIDAQGRWIARLAPGEVGDVRAAVDFTPRLTAFGSYGNQPMLASTLALLAVALGVRLWRRVRGGRAGRQGVRAASATAAMPD